MSLWTERGDYTILGLSLYDAPPVGQAHIQFIPGVTALYGLNGVGKTRILNGLSKAMNGEALPQAGAACLHLRIAPPEVLLQRAEANKVSELNTVLTNVMSDMTERLASEMPDTVVNDAGQDVPFEDLRYEAGSAVPSTYATLLAWLKGAPRSLGEAIGEQCLITLVATGSGSHDAGWDVFVSFVPDEGVLREPDVVRSQVRGDSMFGPIISRDHLWKPGTPAWVPVPLFYCGEFERFEARFFEVSDESFDLARVNEKTARVCASGNPLFDVKSEAEHIAVPVVEAAGELEAEANRLLALLLEDAPALRFDFGSPRRWFLGDQPCWRAVDKSTGAEISIDDLSSAQKRWAQMVMSLKTDAGAARVGHARLILIDEPESALHPRAQRRIVEGLKHLAATESVPVIVATHSPVLLDDSDVRLLHVSRAHDGLAEVSSIESPLKLGADALGVSPSQLVQLYRVILLVEGEHDRAVFEGVLGPEFEEARTLIVPMRGANNLVTIPDSRILFDFTDATLVVALDNAPLEKYRPGWESAVVLAAQGKRMKALFELRRAVAEATPESLKIHEFCQRAIETGRTDRVEIYGLSKKDIIEYLPIQSFLPDAQSWDEVKKEWNDAGGAKELNLKDFLRRKGADVTTERIRETAGQLQELPYEFRELLELCQSKSHLRVVL